MQPNPQQFKARVIILGASNVTRGMSTVIETCRILLGAPLEIMAAIGHGRSYGIDSSVLIRTLPGILHCGLWDALAESVKARPQTPTYALITDIGNDVMYSQPPGRIIEWVEQCIDRLRAHDARIAMTTTPIEGIRTLKRWQYAIVKSILFPSRRLSFEQAIERASQLHDGLVALAHRRGIQQIELLPDWYGFDPIHIRMRWWSAAWMDLLGKAFAVQNESVPLAGASLLRWAKLRTSMPQEWKLLGHVRHTAQPSCIFDDGTTLSLY